MIRFSFFRKHGNMLKQQILVEWIQYINNLKQIRKESKKIRIRGFLLSKLHQILEMKLQVPVFPLNQFFSYDSEYNQ